MTDVLPSALPSFTSDAGDSNSTQYRPSKDVNEFNALLPPQVEFIEGSSSGTLAVPDGKYLPINKDTPVKQQQSVAHGKQLLTSSPQSSRQVNGHKVTRRGDDLHPEEIDVSFPENPRRSIGAGLWNRGNTCFLNSALQCVLHTPPMLHQLLSHTDCCLKAKGMFCLTCQLKVLANHNFNSGTPFDPKNITNHLNTIAKHLRKGRQEDSHEFLRYAIDAIQKSCLLNANVSLKVEPKIANTTWIHKIFGGELRSRVHCKSCGYNSDTFDNILDLSLDIQKCRSLEEALRRFVAPDHLKGDDKYKCEKCKKHVTAEKRFTIHRAPVALTVQLKRFSPWGKKITDPIDYKHNLTLRPYMSEGQFGPSYSLYGIVCHSGGGPHSGHYTAMCKSRDGKWFELNDEDVHPMSQVLSRKTAYMLFYLRTDMLTKSPSTKRPLSEDSLTSSPPAKKPFIGPQIPSHLLKERPDSSSAARQLKASIAAHEAKKPAVAKANLVPDYGSDDGQSSEKASSPIDMPTPSPSPRKDSSPPAMPSTPRPTPSTANTNGKAIPVANFYGGGSSSKKRKQRDEDFSSPRVHSSPSISAKAARSGANPFNRFKSGARMKPRIRPI